MHNKIKTLVIEYAPRGDESRTKKLRQYFTKLVADKADITIVDLAKNPPTPLNEDQIKAYYKRNYAGESLTSQESELLKQADEFRDQLMKAEVVIISSPMYNFGYPAAVKAWIDMAIQRGFAYTVGENGHEPKLGHLKVITLYTSGIVFDQINENEHWNGLAAEGPRLFEYMGACVRVVHLEGVDMLAPHNVEYRTKQVAQLKLNTLAKNFFAIDLELLTYEDKS